MEENADMAGGRSEWAGGANAGASTVESAEVRLAGRVHSRGTRSSYDAADHRYTGRDEDWARRRPGTRADCWPCW